MLEMRQLVSAGTALTPDWDAYRVAQLAHNIEALASKGDLTFAAVGTRDRGLQARAQVLPRSIADLTNTLCHCFGISNHDTAT